MSCVHSIKCFDLHTVVFLYMCIFVHAAGILNDANIATRISGEKKHNKFLHTSKHTSEKSEENHLKKNTHLV